MYKVVVGVAMILVVGVGGLCDGYLVGKVLLVLVVIFMVFMVFTRISW